jgi:Spy/CpxP family protein refolding chaperone
MRAGKSSILGVLILGLGISLPGHARGGEFHEKMAEELNLSGEQREQLKKVFTNHREERAGRRKAMKAAREDLQKALRSEASQDEVRKKFSELKKEQDALEIRRFEKVLAIREILTLEQRQKFKDLEHKHWGPWKFKHKYKRMKAESREQSEGHEE